MKIPTREFKDRIVETRMCNAFRPQAGHAQDLAPDKKKALRKGIPSHSTIRRSGIVNISM